jgi:iron(III) transport system ATP-binding protein/putative spermidine/putrescine transport system ATP-binding protein
MINTLTTKKLFGVYNYDITFKSGVNILLGPNGCGKSTLLRVMSGQQIDDSVVISKDSARVVLYDKSNALNTECFNSPHFVSLMNKSFKISKKRFNANGTITINDKEIPFEVLSSGEQHWIKMFAFLYAHKDCTVCIDEPESSLHINLQEKFIDEVKYICESNNLQVIIVTHSPNIIYDHIDDISQWEINAD